MPDQEWVRWGLFNERGLLCDTFWTRKQAIQSLKGWRVRNRRGESVPATWRQLKRIYGLSVAKVVVRRAE